MTSQPPEALRWGPRQWLYAGGLVLGIQVGAIFLLSEREASLPRPAVFPTAIHWAVDPASARSIASLPGLRDPTVFALPSLEGFSGSAWLKFSMPPFQVSDRIEPPRWLALQPARLGVLFAQAVATNAFPPLLVADKPMPDLIGSEPSVTAEPQVAASEVELAGRLAQRSLAFPLALPSWPNSDLLSNTTVQILVNDAGYVLSAIVLESCRLKAADDYATAAAREARFQPLRPAPGRAAEVDGVTYGKLIFKWHTVAPPVPAPAPAPKPAPTPPR
jgi:hypothetical protein